MTTYSDDRRRIQEVRQANRRYAKARADAVNALRVLEATQGITNAEPVE